MVDIRESETSLLNRFLGMVDEYLGGLQLARRKRGSQPYHSLTFVKRRFFSSDQPVVAVHLPAERGGHLFGDDRWPDLVIKVYDEAFWDSARNLSAAYETVSAKRVALVRGF